MKKYKRLLSILLSLVIAVTSSCVAFFAYAVTDYTNDFDLQVYYYDENKELVEVTEQVEVMEQYDVQLYACLVYGDGTVWNINTSGMPAGLESYTVDWTSDARYLAFCEKNDGKIHGYDATKGEAIRNWINNEVATTPVVGSALAKAITAALENGTYDIDDLDTADVIKILDKLCDSLNVSDESREKLKNSVKDYLDKYDVGITATLKDADGNKVDSDTVRVLVLKSDAMLSDVIPNAAFIKNYDDIPTKLAVGYEMDLEGIITPVRTHYTCSWTVTGQLGVLGSDLAEIDENGHFKAIGEGTVQIKVSPDVEGLTKKLTDAFNAIGAAGELVDNESIAKAILLILGIKSDSDNYSTLLKIINGVLDSGIDVDGALQFSKDNLSPLVNFILYVIYQDAITVQIVSPGFIPIESYDIEGETDITEGEISQFKFTNVMPKGAVAHDYKVSLEDEEIAVQTEKNGLNILGIDGSTWNNNYVTPNKTNLVVEMDGITKKTELKIYGKNNKKIVYIKLGCNEYLPVDTIENVNPTTYPKRLEANLSYGWLNEDGTYTFATADAPAYTSDGICYVTANGEMFSTGCTVNTLVVQDADGATATKQIMSGIQTTGVEFTKKHFWYKASTGVISTGIRGKVCEVSAKILPYNASFKELTFTSKDTESVIISATPLTTAQYANAALTEARRKNYATAKVTCDENGYATVYAYAIGNDSCFAYIDVESQTGGFTDTATVAFANISVQSVSIYSNEDDKYKQEDGSYLVTAGDMLDFDALVSLSQTGSFKDQGFEDVDWTISMDNGNVENFATISDGGIFRAIDVGTVNVTATSVFMEITDTVSVRILPNYKDLQNAMAECDFYNLDSYDWSYDSWNTLESFYKEAEEKMNGNLFTSQKEVDQLTQNLKDAFNGLVRYMPLENLEISCNDDADKNGFATINVGALKDYTDYSTTIVPTVYPLEAQDYKVIYTSSNPSMITVDDNGVCHPVSKSDAAWSKITVSVTDPKNGNEFSKEMYVAFAKYQVSAVTVSPTEINFVGVGADAETEQVTISTDFKSSSVTKASIRYGFFVSSNENVATVDGTGNVVPVDIGSCEITFYSYDGGYTATTTVNVSTNKNKLKSAIDIANGLVEEFYTEESYKNVMDILVIAKEIYDNQESSQESINNIAEQLNTAINSLERNPYANVLLIAGEGGSVKYQDNLYKNDKIKVLIENGLQVQAVADLGYHFVKWIDENGNTISTNESENFTINYSAHFEAVFEKVKSVSDVKIFVNDTDTGYYTKDVGILQTYTSQSVKITSAIYPQDANFYEVYYSLNNSETTLKDGKLSPSSNNTCYSKVTVTAVNTITGERFEDSVYVAFVKYPLARVSANPTLMEFNGVKADSQNITISYASSGNQTPSLKRGEYKSLNPEIASVDGYGNVSPVSIGAGKIEFTSFDGGYKAYVDVKVYADKSALNKAYEDITSLDSENYTVESFVAVEPVINSAKAVMDKEFASQEEVDDAVTLIQETINSLVLRDILAVNLVTNGNGSVTINGENVSTLKVNRGDTVTIKAEPNKDYLFDGWFNDDNEKISGSQEHSFVANEATTLTARFSPVPYIEKVTITYDGKETDFAAYGVSLTGRYTSNSVSFGVNVYPQNADYKIVGWRFGNVNENLVMTDASVKPSSNDPAYGQVVVTVKDNYSGKEYTDYIYVSFAKVMVYGVTVNPEAMTFDSPKAVSQSISASYKGVTAVSKPSIQKGFYVSDNEAVATVDNNGVVTPKSKGSCVITHYSYDGGFSASTYVTVNGYSISGRVVEMISPTNNTGSTPVAGALVKVGDNIVATDSNGNFTVEATSDTATIIYQYGVTRIIDISGKTGHIGNIAIIACDAVNDGYINAKDYAKLKREGASKEKLDIVSSFFDTTRYTSSFYK